MMARVSIKKRNGFYYCKVWSDRAYIKYSFQSWTIVKDFTQIVCYILTTYKGTSDNLRKEIINAYSMPHSIDRCLYGGYYGLMARSED